MKRKAVLGISAFYHDSAAALIVDGKVIAAAQEERFTRKKHDAGFPELAVKFVLEKGCVNPSELACVVFYDKPFIKFERLLETYHAFAPKGLASFVVAIPAWIKEKLFMRTMVRKELRKLGIPDSIGLLFPEHHLSHAASAFYPSPFEKAAVLTVDGVGEWATTTISIGDENGITMLKELHFPHSVGLLYSAFTYYCGFKVNSGEYKLMGLAPYGVSGSPEVEHFKKLIKEDLIDVREDGSLLLNMHYFEYATGFTMTHNKRWEKLFGLKNRTESEPLTQAYMNLALAIQQVTDEIVIKLAQTAKEITGCENLVMAGGVALNCVSNGKIFEQKIFKNIWVQPAAGDAGGAVGAAYCGWNLFLGQPKKTMLPDAMNGSYLGPDFSDKEIEKLLAYYEVEADHYPDFDELAKQVAGYMNDGKVIGWFQGAMEFGPRALGNRSIIGDPRNKEMQKKMNLKVKFRESFRPFAPAILEEDIERYCEYGIVSPYMLFVSPVKKERCYAIPDEIQNGEMFDRLYFQRSDLPAITHVDYSARVQTVSKNTNERFWTLINSFKALTGYGIVINTSFNVRGEPIVCTPMDALRCFINTDIDYLVLDNFCISKAHVAHLAENFAKNYRFELD